MQSRIVRSLIAVILTFGLTTITVVRAASEKDHDKDGAKEEKPAQKVALADLPAAIRATIDKEIPGAEIQKIDKEQEHGKVVYDVEATLKGKGVELDIASDGSVIGREDSVPFASLPAAVRATAEKYFGGPGDYEANKKTENGAYVTSGLFHPLTPS